MILLPVVIAQSKGVSPLASWTFKEQLLLIKVSIAFDFLKWAA